MTRIAEIRTHPLSGPLAETLYTAHECHQKAHLIVVEVRTDDGLVGTAEIHATPMAAVCDWVGRFAALLKGPHTLEARTDPDITVTLPNHTGMVTGRLFKGPQGHNWLPNDLPPTIAEGGTLHAAHGSYVPSMWDVAHDHGLLTGMIASKEKFILYDNSYREEQGAPDVIAPDHGRAKLDIVELAFRGEGVERKAEAALDRAAIDGRRSLWFLHSPTLTSRATARHGT